MSLDLSSGLTATGQPGELAHTPSRRRSPRVLAVVHARSGEHLVAALAGLAAQSRQPDVLVGIDCLPAGATALEVATPEPHPVEPSPEPEAEDAFGETFAELSHRDDDEDAYPGDDELAIEDHSGGAASGGDSDDPDLQHPDTQHPDAAEARETGSSDTDSTELPLSDADGQPVVDQGSTQLLQTASADTGGNPTTGPDPHAVLAAHCDTVLTQPPATTVNAAVAAALAWSDDHPEGHEDPTSTEDWIWLLTDADRPSMKALEHLLDCVKVSANVAVVGAKHRTGPTGRDLVDVGVTTTRLGRIITYVEPGEPDQGQRDHVADTLAVPLSGMLVRRDVWEKLQGLDPAVQRHDPLDAAVDFCRRVWLAGFRVEVQPTAVLTAPRRNTATSRRARTHRRLAGAPLLAVPFVALSVVLGALVRVLAGIVAKEPLRALHHSAVSLIPLLRPDQVLRARWRSWRSHKVPRRRLTPLLATTKDTLRWQRERWQRTRPRLVSPAGDDAVPLALWKPTALLVVMAAAGVTALLRLVRSGPFSSAATPALTDEVSGLWAAVTSSWVPAGLGAPGPVDPILAVLTVLGVPVGSPRLAALILLLAALPLATWSAWWATGGLTRRTSIRALCAIAWAASPVLLLAIAEARLAIVCSAIFLPLAVRAIGQAIASHTRRSGWAWAAGGGLLLIPATAGLPILALGAGVLLLLVAARARRLAVAFAAAPPVVMALPVLLASINRPALLFAEPGTALTRASAPAWAALFGWPTAPSAATGSRLADGSQFGLLVHRLLDDYLGAAVVTGALNVLPWLLGSVPLVLAIVGLRVVLRGSPRGAVARTGWMLTSAGAVLAVGSAWFVVAREPSGPVVASASSGTVVAVLGLLLAGSAGWGPPGQRRTGFMAATGRGARRLAGLGLVGIALATIVGWTALQVLAPALTDVRNGANPPIPAAVMDAATSADQVRVVTVRATSVQAGEAIPGLEISVVRGTGPDLLHTAAAVTVADTGADTADKALADAVVRTVRGDADARELLAPFGVGAIVLLPGDENTTAATAQVGANLDSTLGLGPGGRVGDVRAWRVNSLSGEATAPDRPAAVRLVPAEIGDGPAWVAVPSDGWTVDTQVQATAGTVVLAERFDPGWQATLNDRVLKPVRVDGWAQGFEIGTATGELEIEHRTDWHRAIGWAQVIVVCGALLIAIPVRGRTEEAHQ